jgi:hypothetical protein
MLKAKRKSGHSGRVRIQWPTLTGAAAFCGLTGAPESVVKYLRADGKCDAFLSNNRIHSLKMIRAVFGELLKAGELPSGIATPQDWKALEQARRESIKRKHDEKLFMLTADAMRQASQAMALTFAEWERLARELPPAVAGLAADEVGERMTVEIERMRKTLTKKFMEIGK